MKDETNKIFTEDVKNEPTSTKIFFFKVIGKSNY